MGVMFEERKVTEESRKGQKEEKDPNSKGNRRMPRERWVADRQRQPYEGPINRMSALLPINYPLFALTPQEVTSSVHKQPTRA